MSSEALWMQIVTNACPFHCHTEGESLVLSGALFAPKLRRQGAKVSAEG